MKKTIVSLAVAASLACVPLLSLGADTPGTPDNGLMKPPPNTVTLMCRAAGPNEKPTGTINSVSVVCKSNQAMMVNGMMKVPKTSGLDAAGTDQAWRDWLTSTLSMQPRAGDG